VERSDFDRILGESLLDRTAKVPPFKTSLREMKYPPPHPFWDVGHAPKDQSNRRKYMPDYAVWEIHPVMELTVQ